MRTIIRIRLVRRPFRFGVHIHVWRGADRGEGIAQSGFSGGTVILERKLVDVPTEPEYPI